MADINIGNLQVEHGSTQIVGDEFRVTVPVVNQETLAPMPWNASRCEITKDNGEVVAAHEATVEVDIRGGQESHGSGKTTVCAPIKYTPELSDPTPSWEFALSEPGDYDIVATVTPAGNGQPSTKRRSITVEETGQQRDADDGSDDSGGLSPFGDADGDGVPNYRDSQPQNPEVPGDSDPLNLDGKAEKAALLLALLVVAWLASSASNTVEALT